MKCPSCSSDRIRIIHCDGEHGENRGVTWGCPIPGKCHLAVLCLRCDRQWNSTCLNHPSEAVA